MIARRIALAVATASFLCAAPVHAQAPGGSDPADPRARASELKYESAFAGYRAAKGMKPEPWKQVIEEIGSLGGPMGHPKAIEKKSDANADGRPETAPSIHKH